MPHKRAKRSIRDQTRADRQSDLPPSQPTFTSNDIPKSMARVLNAEAVQTAWRAKKRALEADGEVGGKRKKQKTGDGGEGKGKIEVKEIKIKPGESLRHFKRRVEDDMRPVIRSAMKNTTSTSKQKSKESQKYVGKNPNLPSGKSKKVADEGDEDEEEEDKEEAKNRRRGKKSEREPSPEFARWSSSTPRRLNDIAQAPPELKPAPRLNRLAASAKKKRSESKDDGDEEDEDVEGRNNVVSLQHRRMMELEREKAINRYRALKDARLREQQKTKGALVTV